MKLRILALPLALSACTTSPPAVREVAVTREVPVPYHQPCPRAEDKPAKPTRLHVEQPVMPEDRDRRERLMAAKILELFAYADEADGIMTECGRQR